MLDLLKEVIDSECSELEREYKRLEKEYKKKYQNTISDIAEKANVARGTVVRWLELESVPKQYAFDLMKMAGREIDYTQFSYKEKDQFYTPTETAKYCYDVFCEKLKDLNVDESILSYIEPSAGAGAFLDVLPENRTIALDVEPRDDRIEEQDYLTWSPSKEQSYVVFGNPPFGLRGQLALKFVNHSHNFADFVCFILPQLFESDGKGSPRKRVKDYNLYHTEKLDTVFHEPDGKEVRVECIFQIWSKHHENKDLQIQDFDTDLLTVYSLSNGDTPSQQRNTKMIGKCNIYLPSTCFGANNMICYDFFEDLPGQKGYGVVFHHEIEKLTQIAKEINWTDVSFLSTNSALNLRTSKILEVLLKNT